MARPDVVEELQEYLKMEAKYGGEAVIGSELVESAIREIERLKTALMCISEGHSMTNSSTIRAEALREAAKVARSYAGHVPGGAIRIEQAILALIPTDAPDEAAPFQVRVNAWIMACFGEEIAKDVIERNHRFLEEALELVQSKDCTQSEAHQLVDYVYGRPAGDPVQEVGGVLNTLSALCTAAEIDMDAAGERELARVWTMVEKIRAKQAAKPHPHPPVRDAYVWQSSMKVSEMEALKEIATLRARLAQVEGALREAREPIQAKAFEERNNPHATWWAETLAVIDAALAPARDKGEG